MADNKNLPAELPVSDFTELDRELLTKFVADGLPQIASVDEVTLLRMTELYMNGKTYREISMIANVKKAMVIFFSEKYGWYPARAAHLNELQETMQNRVYERKLKSKDFMINIMQYWERKLGNRMSKFLSSGDEEFAVSTKEVSEYLKTAKTLFELNDEGAKKGSKPAIGLNVGDGVTITKTGDNSMDITPTSTKTVDSLLSRYAEEKRREAEARENRSDIKEEEDETDLKGETVNEDE